MNVDAIKQILDLVREHELTEFELEQGGVKLRVRKQGAAPPAPAAAPPWRCPGSGAGARRCRAGRRRGALRPPRPRSRWSCRSPPIVGTFYRST